MRTRLLTGISAALLALGPCIAAQNDARQPAKGQSDDATKEARRQAAVTSMTGQSRPQTMRQAIEFERHKERAAARQARIEARDNATNSNADRRKQETTPARQKDR